MGCFLACFGSSKDAKRQKQRIHVLPRDQRNGSFKPVQSIVSQKQESIEQPISLVSEIREKPEEQLSFAARKKVTFDSNVRTYEPISVHGSIESLPESTGEKATEENLAKSSRSNLLSDDDSNTSSLGSYPPNHRYQNCAESDDEEDEMQYGDSDPDDEDDEYNDSDEEDNDILGSKTRISPAQVITEEVDPKAICPSPQRELKTIGANPNARDRSTYVHPVLNPVENLTQWKAVKGKGTPPLKLQKENLTSDKEPPRLSFSMEPNFKQSSFSNKSKINEPENLNQEIAVNASLSNWLVSSETTPTNKTSPIGVVDTISYQKGASYTSNSPRSQEDRPILGALTLEEIRQFSASNSPRRSPTRSPDDMPILGTVGTYWSHTGPAKDNDSASYKGIPNTTSKYREDKRVNWHSTPFEARLEKALSKGVPEA
ncbi:hypothetical protein AAG906_040768 [Vitis piasezkii]